MCFQEVVASDLDVLDPLVKLPDNFKIQLILFNSGDDASLARGSDAAEFWWGDVSSEETPHWHSDERALKDLSGMHCVEPNYDLVERMLSEDPSDTREMVEFALQRTLNVGNRRVLVYCFGFV